MRPGSICALFTEHEAPRYRPNAAPVGRWQRGIVRQLEKCALFCRRLQFLVRSVHQNTVITEAASLRDGVHLRALRRSVTLRRTSFLDLRFLPHFTMNTIMVQLESRCTQVTRKCVTGRRLPQSATSTEGMKTFRQRITVFTHVFLLIAHSFSMGAPEWVPNFIVADIRDH